MADAKLARCPRCKAHTLVAERQGIRVAVDIAPADAIGFGVAASRGVDLYWVEKAPGRGLGLVGRFTAAQAPSWGPNGAQAGTQRLHVEHSCGAPARDQVILNVQSPKGSAPATPGAPGAGSHRSTAPAGAAPGLAIRSPASPAIPRHSEVLGRCGVCDRRIQPGSRYWAITWGTEWIDGQHEECP